jgi:4-hydroxymandelate oxidase
MADGQSYGEMAAALLPDEPVDALVLAYDIPDIAPGRATATYLSHLCPGGPQAFAVSDQGRAGAHTALRLLLDYARSGTYERALLLVAEQRSLPYDPGVPVELPAAHCAVAVHLGPSTLEASVPRIVPGVDLADVPGLLGDLGSATVVLGGHLADIDVKADTVVLADPDQPMTGVWEALAALDGPVVLADYDPALRYLCVS